jgi:hypothetical protein
MLEQRGLEIRDVQGSESDHNVGNSSSSRLRNLFADGEYETCAVVHFGKRRKYSDHIWHLVTIQG